MKPHIRHLSFLCTFGVLIGIIPLGLSDETPPPLIQELLEKEGATLTDLKADPSLRERLRQHLYQKRGAPAPQRKNRRTPRRTSVKLPPYCQVIVDNNLFRPLGYREYKWTLKLELVGTMIYPDPTQNTAILHSNHPKYRRLILRTGDRFLEELTITQIQAHQITYTNKAGEYTVLRLPSPFTARAQLSRKETP